MIARTCGSSLDFVDEIELVVDIASLEQLLAEVVAARGEAEILRPFNDGVDQDRGWNRVAGQV